MLGERPLSVRLKGLSGVAATVVPSLLCFVFRFLKRPKWTPFQPRYWCGV